MGVGAVATAIATREPVLISEGAGGVGEPLTRREAFRSLMVAPLVVAGSPIGVLEVACRTRRLGGRADRLLSIVADRAAVAIEHARLENEARELAEDRKSTRLNSSHLVISYAVFCFKKKI